MSDETSDTANPSVPIIFGRRLAESENFWQLFREGMALVEETASYLDGVGKVESRYLPRAASVSFGTESMRLTTRLMQLASWLLLQRAINDGSMSVAQADNERSKVKLGALATATEGPGWDGLPDKLQRLIRRSLALQEKVVLLDKALRTRGQEEVPASNPVGQALGQLNEAFGKRS